GYDLNVPFWSDGAVKTRWFSVPDTNRFITFSPEVNWTIPNGAVWIKHFELELTNGVPESAQRLETRFLVYNTNGGYGVTYRWGDSLTNAALVVENGLDEEFIIRNLDGLPIRTQVWHYPSRVECMQCHSAGSGFALGFTTAQLNRDYQYDGTTTNQIAALSAAGYFDNTVSHLHTLKALAHPTNELVSLEYRARSWLAANCANCHRPDGVQMALWDARPSTPTDQAGIINGPLVDNGNNPNNKVVVPGSTSLSVLLQRIATTGEGRMPPIGSSQVDTEGVNLLSAWITNALPSYTSFAQWQTTHFGATNAPNGGAQDDPDSDLTPNHLEYLTGTDPHSAQSRWEPSMVKAGAIGLVAFPQIANRAFEVQSSPTLFPPAWTPVDVPQNAPFYSISNRPWSVPQELTDTNRFYRVRVSAP
ncbi:MAG TPA: c-type cytochrome, partial [Clostridia bacterium]|nr:c-type cytochrome [Clostridia bacterium]